MNILKPNQRATLETLLGNEISQHEIARKTGIDRKTVRKYAREFSKSPMATGSEPSEVQNPPPRPPEDKLAEKSGVSSCAPFSEWIQAQVELGRNAMAIYQDLVEQHGFTSKYNSVKRFVRTLKTKAPERFDVLEFEPGEEAQVDFGQGALTLHPSGKYRKPNLFVMTLKYSRKSFRKTVWSADQVTWAKLHEQAFRYFGGCVRYVVLDNLKAGVIKPDTFEPILNPIYAAVLKHYGVAGDPARVRDPNRKGTVESAIQHTQGTALKGRQFETIEKQNEWLMHWEERWAAARIHGRTKRQVLEMFTEEKPYLKPLPLDGFKYFETGVRTVDDAGVVQVKGSFYSALPADVGQEVVVRIFEESVEIYDDKDILLRRHAKAIRKGQYQISQEDRLFNPSRETTRILERAALIGPQTREFCIALFQKHGRLGQKMMFGIVGLPRQFKKEDIERACEKALRGQMLSYQVIKKILENTNQAPSKNLELKQTGNLIRPLTDYQQFWDNNTKEGDSNGQHQ